MELILANATVLTMNPARDVLEGVDVVVREGRIAAVGARLAAKAQKARVVDVRGKVVVPGFVHGHLHACQTLLRHRAEGLELLDWLRERVWPLEGAHDAQTMRASADLTFAELIKSGSTAALDMGSVHHYDAVFEAARDSGFRLTGGKCLMDAGHGTPAGLRETTESALSESLRLLETWHGAEEGRLRYAFAPRFVLSCSEPLLRQVAEQAKARGVRIHSHASENVAECEAVRHRTGEDNVVHFHRLGISGAHVTLAHCVWLTALEQRTLKETGTVVCHCPSSNLKLASGIAKVPELLEDGVQIALGADGAPCNNNLDMFVEMRLAALLHKPRCGPQAMPAMKVLELATLGGARALGLEAEIGSVEVGKRADLTVVDLSGVHLAPRPDDVATALVYGARGSDVTDVFIDGRWVLRDRTLTTLDEQVVRKRAEAAARTLESRVG